MSYTEAQVLKGRSLVSRDAWTRLELGDLLLEVAPDSPDSPTVEFGQFAEKIGITRGQALQYRIVAWSVKPEYRAKIKESGITVSYSVLREAHSNGFHVLLDYVADRAAKRVGMPEASAVVTLADFTVVRARAERAEHAAIAEARTVAENAEKAAAPSKAGVGWVDAEIVPPSKATPSPLSFDDLNNLREAAEAARAAKKALTAAKKAPSKATPSKKAAPSKGLTVTQIPMTAPSKSVGSGGAVREALLEAIGAANRALREILDNGLSNDAQDALRPLTMEFSEVADGVLTELGAYKTAAEQQAA